MPIYEYKSESGETIEKIMPMNDEHPTTIVENGMEYHRVFGNSEIIIPWHKRSGNGFKFDYSKSPSRRKHVF